MRSPRRRWSWCLAVCGVGLLVAGCADAAADNATVMMTGDLRFEPAAVDVPVGGTVTWQNDGITQHTVTAVGEDREPTGAFDSGTVIGTGTFAVTFEQPGSYLYLCRFHGDREMVGLVEVVP